MGGGRHQNPFPCIVAVRFAFGPGVGRYNIFCVFVCLFKRIGVFYYLIVNHQYDVIGADGADSEGGFVICDDRLHCDRGRIRLSMVNDDLYNDIDIVDVDFLVIIDVT